MGDLGDIGISDLLYLLALRSVSGKLAISGVGEDAAIYLDRGRLIAVTSTNMSARLGRMLVRIGAITSGDLRNALKLQEQRDSRTVISRILLEQGLVTQHDLAHCIEEQAIDLIARLILADNGQFNFQRDVPPPSHFAPISLNSDRILVDAGRRAREWHDMRDLIQPPQTAVTG